MNQANLAKAFRELHYTGRPLVLPNVWDALSARVIENAGALAIATSSAGVSWALGRSDGHGLARAQAIEATRRIVGAVGLPVSADIESGYGDGTTKDIAETVEAVIEAGAVGINIEDAPGRNGDPLVSTEEQVGRIRAARAAGEAKGIDLFINARTDVFLAAVGDPEKRLEAVIRRAAKYLEAGADSIFVPAVTNLETIADLVAGIGAPLNILVGPGAPSVADLANLGVARVSLGSSVALGAYGLVRRAVQEALTAGTYELLDEGLSFGEVNALFKDE